MIVWLDLETTGLDPRTGSILEIAIVITDDELNEVGTPYVSLVKSLDEPRGLSSMDAFVKNMHTKSGLLDDLAKTGELHEPWNVALDAGMFLTASLVKDATDLKSIVKATKYLHTLAGSSIHFDRSWLAGHMTELLSDFSHRMIDVSSLTEMAKRWAPEIYAKRPGLGPDGKPLPMHRALDDIRNSIETLRYYRKTGFVGGTP
jgi:oligoribonuclease